MKSVKIYWPMLLSVFFCSCTHYNTFGPERSKGLDDPAALKELIDTRQTVDDGDYRIVDVRPKNKYDDGHIPTAVNLPDGNLYTDGESLPRDKFIIVYCETGGRSETAVRKMAKAGYYHIYNWGGVRNWTYDTEK